MPDRVTAAFQWFIDGLTDAGLSIVGYVRSRQVFRVVAANGNAIMTADGQRCGTLVDSDAILRLEPPGLAEHLKSAVVMIDLPARWVWRRDLQQIGKDNVSYLDAFVAHHIERISPWRADHVYYQIMTQPASEDAARLNVEVGIVAKSLVEPLVTALKPLAAELYLTSSDMTGVQPVTISVGSSSTSKRLWMRRLTIAAVAVPGVAIGVWIAGVQWVQSDADEALRDLDRQIAAKRSTVNNTRTSAAPAAADTLRTRRATQPYVVNMLEALSLALPDHAHLLDLRFEKDAIRMSGISSQASDLVSTLERSGHFLDVRYTAATTRMDDSRADRFYLEMRSVSPSRSQQ